MGQPEQVVHISVVIPCRNEIRHIRACLDSVFCQELRGIEMEILVADGMSDDGTREILRQYEQQFDALRVLDNPGKIVSTGMNRAIREARGEIIVRMDVHSVYAPNYVQTCVEVLRETSADNVGGPALTKARGYMARAIACAFHTRFASGGAKFHNPHYEGLVDTVPYGCWRKSTLERLGPLDETLVRSQDDELNVRLVESGGRVWQSPKIVSWYWPRASLAGLFRQYFQYGFWKVAVIRKHRRLAAWRNLVPSLSLVVGAALVLCAVGANLAGSSAWLNTFLVAWGSLAALYAMTSLCFAVTVASKNGWGMLLVMPVVFATYHFSYALGFLLALVYCPAVQGKSSPMMRAPTAITR
jgi:succinoglycan biosynthesis protein ExoA